MAYIGRALLMQTAMYLTASLFLGYLPETLKNNAFVSVSLKLAVFLLPVFVYCKLSEYNLFDRSKAKKQPRSRWALSYITALSLTVTAVNLLGVITSKAVGAESQETVFSGAGDAVGAFLTSVVLASVLEEFLFRGAFFHASEGLNAAVRIVLSALCFALMHYSLLQFFYALSAGIVIAFFYSKNGSLRFAILVHAGANFITWLFTVFRSLRLETEAAELVLAIALAVTAVFGCVVLTVKRKETNDSEKADRFIYISPELGLYVAGAILLTVII